MNENIKINVENHGVNTLNVDNDSFDSTKLSYPPQEEVGTFKKILGESDDKKKSKSSVDLGIDDKDQVDDSENGLSNKRPKLAEERADDSDLPDDYEDEYAPENEQSKLGLVEPGMLRTSMTTSGQPEDRAVPIRVDGSVSRTIPTQPEDKAAPIQVDGDVSTDMPSQSEDSVIPIQVDGDVSTDMPSQPEGEAVPIQTGGSVSRAMPSQPEDRAAPIRVDGRVSRDMPSQSEDSVIPIQVDGDVSTDVPGQVEDEAVLIQTGGSVSSDMPSQLMDKAIPDRIDESASLKSSAERLAKISSEIVSRILVSHAALDAKQEVRVRLSNAILPGTEILISKDGTKLSVQFNTTVSESAFFLMGRQGELRQHLMDNLKEISHVEIKLKDDSQARWTSGDGRSKNQRQYEKPEDDDNFGK
ncbi:MAG: hypothetical protein LBB20_01740 [Puniceicoccales bacterium]|jgi:hypothetical protein|nr:hypothetical protein [Puniceicoccales bacterium]